jgi:drug/metabolite transporter (DMT)-like permease
MATERAATAAALGPALALTFNALVWGVSWWPFRWLQDRGLHPLWATALIYALAVGVITLTRPQAWSELLRRRALWVLVFASGATNAAFNWGVTIGDVVRVVLLFYLMPLWAVLLARLVLREGLTRMAMLRVAMALAGAIVVLWPAGAALAWHSLPLPRNLPEWLGVLGGFTFALNNVMLKREAAQSESARALAMFVGGCLVALVVALGLAAQGRISAPPALDWPWVTGALAMGVFFLASNLALQYGAARLPANVTAVVMITEVLFASVSAVLLGAGQLTPALAVGAALIVAASLLAARRG